MKKLIRKIKIHKIIPCLSNDELSIVNYIEIILKNTVVVKYNRSIYYMYDDKWVMETYLDKQINVRYDYMWVYLLDYFSHGDIELLLKFMIEFICKIQVDRVDYTIDFGHESIEEYYKILKQTNYAI